MSGSAAQDQARVRGGGVGRRRMLGVVALAGGGAAFALACGSKTRDDAAVEGNAVERLATAPSGQVAPGAGEQVKRGGTFIGTIGSSPRSMDPHFETFPEGTASTDNIYNGLLRYNADVTTIGPDTATAMPEQPDPLTFVFKIQPGIKYQNVAPANGREMTAEDVKYSIERQMTNDPGKFQSAYFFLNKVSKVEAVDKYTVKFTTFKPYAPFLSYIAHPLTQIILREIVEQDGDLTKRAVGTGPFIFEEWQKDVQFKLRRNPDYFKKDAAGGQLPYIDSYIIRVIPDASASRAAFINNDVHAVGVQNTFLEEVKKQVPKATYRAQPSQFWRQMRTSPYDGEKIQHRKPYTDIRVRQAIVQAVNKREVLDLVLSGDGALAHGPILPQFKTWALPDDPVKFDPADSRKLLEAAGLGSGFDEEMIFANYDDIANQVGEVLKQQMSKIGIRVKLVPMEVAAYFNKTYAYDYNMSHHIPRNNPEPDENLVSYFGPTATFFRWGNKEIQELIVKQSETVDQAERQKLVLDVQRKIVLDYPISFMYTPNNHFFTSAKVKGWFYPNDLYQGRKETLWMDPSA